MRLFLPILTTSMILTTGLSEVANAATATGNLQVKITIIKECQVNTNSATTTGGDAILDFGSHGVLNSSKDAQTAASDAGSIQVQCTNGTAYQIGLGAGVNPSTPGDVNGRRMKNGSEYVGYQLYQDAGRTNVWGNTAGAGAVAGNVVSATADGTLKTSQVFGRVPVQNTPGAGAYSDTVAITVSY